MDKKHLINYSDGSHIVCDEKYLDMYLAIGKEVVNHLEVEKIQRETLGNKGFVYLMKRDDKEFSTENIFLDYDIGCFQHDYYLYRRKHSFEAEHLIAVHNTVASKETLHYKIKQCLGDEVNQIYGSCFKLTKTAVDFICTIKDYEV